MDAARESPIKVELTDESAAHCLKIVFQARNAPAPFEIFLHTPEPSTGTRVDETAD